METQIDEVFAHRLGHAAIFSATYCFRKLHPPSTFLLFCLGKNFYVPITFAFLHVARVHWLFHWLIPGGLALVEGGRAGAFRLLGPSGFSAFAYDIVFRFGEFLQIAISLGLLGRQGLVHRRAGRLEIPLEHGGKAE